MFWCYIDFHVLFSISAPAVAVVTPAATSVITSVASTTAPPTTPLDNHGGAGLAVVWKNSSSSYKNIKKLWWPMCLLLAFVCLIVFCICWTYISIFSNIQIFLIIECKSLYHKKKIDMYKICIHSFVQKILTPRNGFDAVYTKLLK